MYIHIITIYIYIYILIYVMFLYTLHIIIMSISNSLDVVLENPDESQYTSKERIVDTCHTYSNVLHHNTKSPRERRLVWMFGWVRILWDNPELAKVTKKCNSLVHQRVFSFFPNQGWTEQKLNSNKTIPKLTNFSSPLRQAFTVCSKKMISKSNIPSSQPIFGKASRLNLRDSGMLSKLLGLLGFTWFVCLKTSGTPTKNSSKKNKPFSFRKPQWMEEGTRYNLVRDPRFRWKSPAKQLRDRISLDPSLKLTVRPWE